MAKRKEVEKRFMNGKIQVVRTGCHVFHSYPNLVGQLVSTLAYGMGIDKKDIRNVIHYNAARNLEEYSQQIGRGGRDGLPTNCLLLFDNRDIEGYRVRLSWKQWSCEAD